MYVHGHALFICQLPNCNLFTQHVVYLMGETPLVNCGPRSNSLYWNTIYCNTVLLFSANNHHPHYTSNPLLQQAGEIDNLTVSLGQSTLVVLCRFHVGAGISGVAPHYIPPPSTFNVLLGSSWFDKPWFLSEGKLAAVRIIPSSWGSQRTCELHAINGVLVSTSHLYSTSLAPVPALDKTENNKGKHSTVLLTVRILYSSLPHICTPQALHLYLR